MNLPASDMPQGVNQNLYKTIYEECEGILYQMEEYEALIAQNTLFFEKFRASLDQHERRLLEDLVARTCNLVALEMFRMGFSVGRNPATAFDLPDSPYTD